MGQTEHERDFGTRAIHAGEEPDPVTGAQNPPIYQTATFVLPEAPAQAKQAASRGGGYTYTRDGNPTTRVLERKLAALDDAEDSVAAASGMGVISAALLTLLAPGDHLVCSDAIYAVSYELITIDLPRLGIEVALVDVTDLDAVREAIRPNTRVIFTEFLSNPDLRVADIPTLAALASESDVRLLVDNTFATPYLFRPLEHGADLVLHSATKYLSGHGDAVAGIATGSETLIAPMRRWLSRFGAPLSPFNAWLLIRGVKTLHVRMDRHCENAARLADYLAGHPKVSRVHYPGLPNHPGHDLCAGLTSDRFGGMLSFELVGGEDACQRFGSNLQMCYRAVSLGDVSTLVLPWVGRNLVRVSVGLEGIDDIIADFEQALEESEIRTSGPLTT
jgi:methionine-gamma-lyase